MKKLILIGVIIVVAIMQIASITLHSNGIAGYNNSPGEITCTSCHVTYPLNSPGGNVTINVPTSSNNNYIPGQTYTVNVKIARAGIYLFGFSFEALDSIGANAGTITVINPSTTVLINALVNSNNRTNITHYGGVLSNDSCTFSFKWTAPATNVGKITFYAAANASNDDGYTYGDYIYTASQELNPDLSTFIANDKDFESRVYIFPNPTNDRLYIDAGTTDKLIIDLYDVNGRHVFSKTVRNKSNIDITTLSEGTFTIIIKTADRVITKKLVIVR